MDPKDILVIGTRGSLVAFRRDNGQQLWSVHLKGSDFVTIATDEKRVYAHTKGELFCVNLFTGEGVWNDGLKGLGYELATLVLPGAKDAGSEAIAEHRCRQQASANTATSAAQ